MQRGTAQADFRYSKKFLAWAEENPEWTPELMDAWLTNSKKLVKGTKMNFKEKKEAKRADIIAYLQTMGEPTEE
jgi:cytochrome c